ncbi:MAG: phosphoglycerate kinase [Bacteroidales bacterium]|jgi:phosphoglycerate kinase|nr:phosphoglycerate kinase [Bacteroidales bacterium]
MKSLRLLKNADLKDKIVLVRVDHNVVKKGLIHDPYRIDMTFSTLFNIVAKGGKLVLMTHNGRPKNKKTGEIEITADTSVEPIAKYIESKLGIEFVVPQLKYSEGEGIDNFVDDLKPVVGQLRNGEIDAIYLPNTRWFKGEEDKGEFATQMAERLASLVDVYVNDAFGSWQAHTSTTLIAEKLPAYSGNLMQKEVENLDKLFAPKRPLVAVVAGSKFDTKIKPLNALLKQADYLVLGGVIYNAYLCAKYRISINGVDAEDLELAKSFVEYSKQFPGKIVELKHIVESDTLEAKTEGQFRKHNIEDLKAGDKLNFVLDVGQESFEDSSVRDVFLNAETIFVNAVMGFTPNFCEGTIALNKLIDENKSAMKLLGGGDTLQEFKTLLPGEYLKAVDDKTYYMFTGGGAVLEAVQAGNAWGIKPISYIAD